MPRNNMPSFLFLLLVCFLAAIPFPASAGSCVTTSCHQQIGGLKQPHSPVKEGECSSCHKQKNKEHPITNAKSFELQAKGASLCSRCHEALGRKKVVHPPVKDGDCVACHKPHGSANRFLLDVGEDQSGLCLGCHDGAPFKRKYLHGPAAVGECTKCHDPHESAGAALLKGPIRDICLKCHDDFKKLQKNYPVAHPPVRDGPCTSCHDPHGTAVAALLKKKLPDLCISCHQNIGKKIAGVKVPHKPLLQEGGCSNCHAAHYSKAKGLLQGGEMTVCLGCHGVDDLGKPALRNIKKQIEGKKYLHGPIGSGECKACHDPHGSDYFRMLRGNYPTGLYASYKEGIYDACLNCHGKDLLRSAETTQDTGFRNGSQNLHFIHVASRKGRTCRVCHEPHASDGVKLISKEGAKFGDWKIPVNLTITSTGGSCAPGCHGAFKYDRLKAEVYAHKAKVDSKPKAKVDSKPKAIDNSKPEGNLDSKPERKGISK